MNPVSRNICELSASMNARFYQYFAALQDISRSKRLLYTRVVAKFARHKHFNAGAAIDIIGSAGHEGKTMEGTCAAAWESSV